MKFNDPTITSNDYDNECPICLDPFQNVEMCTIQSCGHRICLICIFQIISIVDDILLLKCPICRKEFLTITRSNGRNQAVDIFHAELCEISTNMSEVIAGLQVNYQSSSTIYQDIELIDSGAIILCTECYSSMSVQDTYWTSPCQHTFCENCLMRLLRRYIGLIGLHCTCLNCYRPITGVWKYSNDRLLTYKCNENIIKELL